MSEEVAIEDFAVRIGARLKELRKHAGLTQSEVARRMCTHRPIVVRIESGKHLQTIETITRHARACGFDVHHVTACLLPALSEES